MKTVDFSELIEACDMKVARYRQLIDFMKVYEYLRPPCPYMVKPFKTLFLQNRRAYFHETWYVTWGTPAHHSLLK